MNRLTRADRLYARLLRAYPRAYRQRFEGEMRQTFRDLYREQHVHRRRVWRLWGSMLGDLVVGAATQYGDVIRSEVGMKRYFSSSVSERSFWWGIVLMVPAALFFLSAVAANLFNLPYLNTIRYTGLTLYIFLACLVALPVIAALINGVPLARRVAEKPRAVLTLAFIKRYFWTLVIVVVSLGWVAFLFGHDTVGCAVQYLPHFSWQAFRRCAATH